MAANIHVLDANYCPTPSFAKRKTRETAAQAAGRRYHNKADKFLKAWAEENGYTIKCKPWLKYKSWLQVEKYCQPDNVLFNSKTKNILLIESKIRHTRTAFPQLDLYKGILSALHPGYKISCIELCQYFDKDEYPVVLQSSIRPHDHDYVAVIWDSRYEGLL